jgi:hypothetical protein
MPAAAMRPPNAASNAVMTMAVPKPSEKVERFREHLIHRLRNDLKTGAIAAEPTATRWSAMEQVREPSSIDDRHVTAASALALREHKLLAVLPRGIDHRTPSEASVDDKSHRRKACPATPPPTLDMTTTLSLRHALAVDENPSSEDPRSDPATSRPNRHIARTPSHDAVSRPRHVGGRGSASDVNTESPRTLDPRCLCTQPSAQEPAGFESGAEFVSNRVSHGPEQTGSALNPAGQ